MLCIHDLENKELMQKLQQQQLQQKRSPFVMCECVNMYTFKNGGGVGVGEREGKLFPLFVCFCSSLWTVVYFYLTAITPLPLSPHPHPLPTMKSEAEILGTFTLLVVEFHLT